MKWVATNVDGYETAIDSYLKVLHPADEDAPIVSIDPSLGQQPLRSSTEIWGVIEDINLDTWRLELGIRGRRYAGGNIPRRSAGGHRHPRCYRSGIVRAGFYTLRLTARDIAGRQTIARQSIELRGDPLQSTIAVTDVATELDDLPVAITRLYDVRTADTAFAFGNGWRWSYETALQTNVALTGREETGSDAPYTDQTRLYLWLPDGQRAFFDFVPRRIDLPGFTYYEPAWQGSFDSRYELRSTSVALQRAGTAYYVAWNGLPYNLASPLIDGTFELVDRDTGHVLVMNADGRTIEQRTADGTRLFVGNTSITHPTRAAVVLSRNEHFQSVESITEIESFQFLSDVSPRLDYAHDQQGHLVSVTDAADESYTLYAYSDSSHLVAVAASDSPSFVLDEFGNQRLIAEDLGKSDRTCVERK